MLAKCIGDLSLTEICGRELPEETETNVSLVVSIGLEC
jgi:hypothetical protein